MISNTKNTSAWDQIQEPANQFLKWADGPLRLKFATAPRRSQRHFLANGPDDCLGHGCHHCEHGIDSSVQFDFEVTDHDGSERVFSISNRAAVELKKLKEQLGSAFSTTWIECARTGSGFSTTYKFNVADAPF